MFRLNLFVVLLILLASAQINVKAGTISTFDVCLNKSEFIEKFNSLMTLFDFKRSFPENIDEVDIYCQ